MYINSQEAREAIQALTFGMDYTGRSERLLKSCPEYFSYYNPERLYKAGEVFQINKTDAGIQNQKVKVLVIKDFDVAGIDWMNAEYCHPHQHFKDVSEWVKGEYMMKGLMRTFEGSTYEYTAQNYLPNSNTQPKWPSSGYVKIEEEVV